MLEAVVKAATGTLRSFVKNAAFIVATALSSAAGAQNLLSNGGFESPALPVGGYTTSPFVDGWSFSAGSGVISAIDWSDWWGAGVNKPAGAQGNQFGYLQGVGSISQTFSVASAGVFSVTWIEASRLGAPAGDQTYSVQIDAGTPVLFSTPSAQDFTARGLGTIALASGSHTLTMSGTILADRTVYLDAVTVSAVPEPGAYAMMSVGLLLIGSVALRKRVRA